MSAFDASFEFGMRVPGCAIVLLVASSASAADCFSPAPSVAGGGDRYAAIESSQLSKGQQRSLVKLFKKLKGRWRGDAKGFFCEGKEGAPKKRADDYTIEAEADMNRSGALSMRADLTSKSKGTTRSENLRLIPAGDKLRINKNNVASEAKVLAASSRELHVVLKETLPRAAGFVEIYRRIRVSGSSVTIDYEVYSQGGLSSRSTWRLKKR